MLRGDRHGLKLGVVGVFCLGGRDVSDRLEKASVVEPVDPFEGGELDGLEGASGSAPVNDVRLEEADHRFGEGVVVAIADAADRGLDAGLGEALGVADAGVLAAAIRMMHEPAPCEGPALTKAT